MPADARMRFYTTEKLGPRREMTPEGFLVCYDVPIARTGEQLYMPGETPIEAGSDGAAHIERDAEEVFRPETIASFNGKSVCLGHPDEDVSPLNWSRLSIGIVLNPRRGDGEWKEFMLADFLITREDMIQEVLDGSWEVSAGYDADYEELSPGRGRQVRIVGNHVALVAAGRCGPQCSIRDHATVPNGARTLDCGCDNHQGDNMSTVADWKKRMTDLFKSKDEAAFTKALDSIPTTRDEETHVHVGESRTKFTDDELERRFSANDQRHNTHDERHRAHDAQHSVYDGQLAELGSRISKMEPGTADNRPDAAAVGATADAQCPECGGSGKVDGKECPKCGGTGKVNTEDMVIERGGRTMHCHTAEDKAIVDAIKSEVGDTAVTAHDSSPLSEAFQATIAAAEVISPGIHIPTFDKAANPLNSYKDMYNFRRKAIQSGMRDQAVKDSIKDIRAGKALDEKGLKSMSCQQVHDLFFPLAAIVKAKNNVADASATTTTRGRVPQDQIPVQTINDLNKFNANRWKAKE